MPTPVDASAAAGAIAALVRQALSGKAEAGLRRGKVKDALPKARSHSPSTDLPGMIAARVAELDPDAGDFRSRVLRLLIEAALLQEFGSSVMNAPRFQGLVDLVWREIEKAPQLQADIDAVLGSLMGRRQG